MERNARRIFAILMVLVLVFTIVAPGLAQAPDKSKLEPDLSLTPTIESIETINLLKDGGSLPRGVSKPLANGDALVSVIVQLEGQPLASYTGGVEGLSPTSPDTTGAAGLDVSSPDSVSYLAYLERLQQDFAVRLSVAAPSAQVTHNYTAVLNGVSMIVKASELGSVAGMPGVTSVTLDSVAHPDTDSSPAFIGATAAWDQQGGQGKAGEGVVVGVIDTGIWPEHPSFADDGTYAAPTGGPYACDFGNTAWNPNDAPFTCNNKLIGAYNMLATYKALVGLEPEEYDSARDSEGHGTHTSGTAAGNANVHAVVLGKDQGYISGISPRSQVIMYRVCAAGGCYSSDSAAAVDQAIKNGVNVINFSISGGGNPYVDTVSLAFKDAYAAGIFVAASAGNSGPAADTTDHREPWVTTVAASTQAREFRGTVDLAAATGETLHLEGISLTSGTGGAFAVVSAADFSDERCMTPFAANSVKDKIVICKRGTNARVDKGYNVLQGGAVGMIMYNPTVADVESDNHWLPAVHLNGAEGQQLLTFWDAHKAAGVKATLDGGLKVMGPGDVMAAFSSRGGKGQTLGISKPDVSSIGVQVLAGMTPTPDTITGGPPGELFQAIAGTSMSSPHIAGSAALLKAMHPDWTPGEIKSALMSTAVTKVVKEDGVTPADPFDYGSGREDLSVAGNPGVSVSETSERFTKLENELWNANLPSLYVPVMTGAFVTYRTFQSEAVLQSCWKLTVDAPADMTVKTMPMICLGPKGKPGDRMVIPIAIEARNVPLGEARFATLWAKNGSQTFHMPITIVRRQGPLTVDKTCDPTTLVLGGETACQIKIANTSFDDATYLMKDFLPKGFYIKPGTLDGTPYKAPFFVDAQGKLAGAKPPIVQMRTASYGNGYLPLSSFGVTPVAGVGDDTLVTFNLSRSFIWAGKTYSKIGVSSNGNVVPGSGGSATASNQKFPDPANPNNVLAPFWTDLNLAAGGALRVATLSDGTNRWLVIDWEKAPNFTDGKLNSFQVWIGLNGVEDIAYSYGPDLGSGDPGIGLTVGAENEFGNSGVSWYYNGAGALPLANSDDLIAFTIPGVPGDTKTITYSMISRLAGKWENCAVVNFNMNLQQLSTACVQGMVTKPSTSGPDEISNLIQFIPMVKR